MRSDPDQLRAEMGTYDFSAPHQQAPVPLGGNMICWERFGLIKDQPPTGEGSILVFSRSLTADTTTKLSQLIIWDVDRRILRTHEIRCGSAPEFLRASLWVRRRCETMDRIPGGATLRTARWQFGFRHPVVPSLTACLIAIPLPVIHSSNY